MVTSSIASRAAPQQTLEFSGACDSSKFLNGLKFDKKGITKTGAPFYKARTADYYIYYDPNCGTPGSPQPARWILDNDAPSTQRTADLDGDGDCNYLARADSNDKSAPPVSASWSMHCGNEDWESLAIVLKESFAKVTSSTCEAAGRLPILTVTMCSSAATYLQLSDTTPEVAPKDSESSPRGCFWDKISSGLHLALHASSKGKGATDSLELICRDGGKSENQALLSTAMGGHRNVASLGLLLPTLTWALSCRLG